MRQYLLSFLFFLFIASIFLCVNETLDNLIKKVYNISKFKSTNMKKLTIILGMLCLMFFANAAYAGGDKEDYQPEIVHDTILFRETVDTCNCSKKVAIKKHRTSTISDTTKTAIAKKAETPICKSCTEQPDKDCTLKPLMQPTTLCALENYFDKNCDCNSGQVILHQRLTEARFIELIENVSTGVFGSVPQNNADIASMIRQSTEQLVTLKPGEFQFIRIQNCTGQLSYDDIPREMNVKALVYRDKPWFIMSNGSVLVAKQDTAKIPLDTQFGGKGNNSNNSFWTKAWKFITDYWWLWLLLLLLFLLLLWLSSKFRKIEEDGNRNNSAVREDIRNVATNVQTIKNNQDTEYGKQNEFREVTNANFAKMQETQKETPKDHFAQTAEEKQQQENILKEIQRTIIVDVNVTIITD